MGRYDRALPEEYRPAPRRSDRGGMSVEAARDRAFGGRYPGNRYDEVRGYRGSGDPLPRVGGGERGARGWRPSKGDYPGLHHRGYDLGFHGRSRRYDGMR
jgi:hypothetical protein